MAYKTVLLGVRGFKHREKTHRTLKAAQRYILDNIKPNSHRPAWIYRINADGSEVKLPGQYEVHAMYDTGFKVGLYRRTDHPNRLSHNPIMLR